MTYFFNLSHLTVQYLTAVARGMRAPFLAIGGNNMYSMMYDANFTYDSSMPIYENKPPSFPYTLDYKVSISTY